MKSALSANARIIRPDISDIESIAIGHRIRVIRALRELYGRGRWRKLKGFAKVRVPDGKIGFAELHWYEAHGIGRRKMRIKRFLRDDEI